MDLPPIDYNDTGDVTVTVVAPTRGVWVRREDDWRHMYTYNRCQQNDAEVLQRLSDWWKGGPPKGSQTVQTSEFDVSTLFPSNCSCVKYRGIKRDTSKVGNLPSLTQLLYDGRLGEKTKQQIADEMLQEQRYKAHRIFDCSDSVATF